VSLLWGFLLSLTALASAAEAPVPVPPPIIAKGEALFNNYCARCHGVGAKGTSQGPPFLDKIYAPDHHADTAFYRAPDVGVRAHHWKFGDMPKIPGVTKEELTQIVAYIRWLQKQAGIF
jgi:mono/diheme cytochrome c family protein